MGFPYELFQFGLILWLVYDMIRNSNRKRQVGKVLKMHREKARLSRKALGLIIKTSVSTICRIEKGTANFEAYTFNKLCDFFDINPEEVLYINMDTIQESESVEQVSSYLLKKGAERELHDLVKSSQACYKKPTNIIDELIADGFLKNLKKWVKSKNRL